MKIMDLFRRSSKKKDSGSVSVEANAEVFKIAHDLYEDFKHVRADYDSCCNGQKNEEDVRKKINDYIKDLKELNRLAAFYIKKERKFTTAHMQVILVAKQVEEFLKDNKDFGEHFKNQEKQLEDARERMWDLQQRMI